MIFFQLSDWFPKPIIWAIIVKFDQIRKNWWRISCAGRKKMFRGVVGKENWEFKIYDATVAKTSLKIAS